VMVSSHALFELAEAIAQMKLICAVPLTSVGSLLSLLDPAP
jgi:hypothetical protein